MQRVLCLLMVGMLTSGAMAATINLNEHIANPTFDMDPTTGGAGTAWSEVPDRYYRPIETSAAAAGTLGWFANVGSKAGAYYISSKDGSLEDSAPNLGFVESTWATGGVSHAGSLINTIGVTLNDGDTLRFSFSYSSYYLDNPNRLEVVLYDGTTYGRAIITSSQISTEMQVYDYSYTHSGSALLAGTYVLGFDMYTTGTGKLEGIQIDSLVPEPATIGLLATGGIAALIRRRK